MNGRRRGICGVGINDADYLTNRRVKKADGTTKVISCPYYQVWRDMLYRCYSKGGKNLTYKNCWVDEEWFYFSNFRKWMLSQDWEDKFLDKDLLFIGNRVYSKNRCLFIDRRLNNFLTTCTERRGQYPLGVTSKKSRSGYRASCSDPFLGKPIVLGYYDTTIEAHEAWQEYKHHISCELARDYSDPRIKEALMDRYAPDKDWSNF